MNIIRDEDFGGLMMIPLLNDWNIDRCNVSGCKEKPTTIITGLIEARFGLCESHYQETKKKGKANFTLDLTSI